MCREYIAETCPTPPKALSHRNKRLLVIDSYREGVNIEATNIGFRFLVGRRLTEPEAKYC